MGGYQGMVHNGQWTKSDAIKPLDIWPKGLINVIVTLNKTWLIRVPKTTSHIHVGMNHELIK